MSILKRVLFAISIWCLPLMVFGQKQVTLTFQDTKNNPLEGVVITDIVNDRNIGISNHIGKAVIIVDENQLKLTCTFIGKEDLIIQLNDLNENQKIIRTYIMEDKELIFNSVEIISSWLKTQDPMTSYQMDKEEINKNNIGQDVPYLLQWTPSVVATSDAGAGIGYTGLWIRGTDPTRINVSINGVPVNDSESQAVFWVNMPDFSSSVDGIQIQRGVGASTNGSVAFGATVNMSTQEINKDFYGSLAFGAGSFNTRRFNARFGTGLIKNKYVIEGRVSGIRSDGYIDRASAELQSWFFKSAYLGKKSALKLIAFSGREVTYQAWYGLPIQYLSEPSLRTFNVSGQRSDGSFYENEVDNYRQTHIHLIHNYDLSNGFTWNNTLHYTFGSGYFEQFRENDRLSRYGLGPISIGNQVFSRTDIIRRRWLDNHFYGAISNLNYTSSSSKLRADLGVSYNRYFGDHFGNIIWMRLAGPTAYNHQYYFNDALKTDASAFVKVSFQVGEKWFLYGDLQYRSVFYAYKGNNNAGIVFDDIEQLAFFNPKAGVFYTDKKGNEGYFSIAVGAREPNRADFTNSTTLSKPTPEYLYNSELGYRKKWKQFEMGLNHYLMYYRDQLVLSGQINDVGAYTRVNVPNSYRTGIEFDARWSSKYVYSGLAITISQNKILSFTEYIDDWDNGGQLAIEHKNTDLSFSPNSIGNLILGTLIPKITWQNHFAAPDLSLLYKHVGRQFLDNSSNPFSALDPYSFLDLRLQVPVFYKGNKRFEIKFWVNNLLDQKYVTNGWIYRYASAGFNPVSSNPYSRSETGAIYNDTGLFPQAGRNWLFGVEWFFR
jgi:iron complex outermembrane receptor protein